MLRKFFQIVSGRRDGKPTLPSTSPQHRSPWREAPTRTLTDDIGHGVVLTTTLSTGHHGFVSVVGESHYQEFLRSLVRELGRDAIFIARLVPEPGNHHDANAVVVCEDTALATVGYLPRPVAKSYHRSLVQLGKAVTCPARLTGEGAAAIGVLLDFQPVREALGLARVSVDQGDMDYDAAAEYHRLNTANREFVNETIPLEKSDVSEAIARYRRALATLSDCRRLAETKGLTVYGFKLNQTDARPIDRLTRCLIKVRKPEEAAKELDRFGDEFPHALDMTLLKTARNRLR